MHLFPHLRQRKRKEVMVSSVMQLGPLTPMPSRPRHEHGGGPCPKVIILVDHGGPLCHNPLGETRRNYSLAQANAKTVGLIVGIVAFNVQHLGEFSGGNWQYHGGIGGGTNCQEPSS